MTGWLELCRESGDPLIKQTTDNETNKYKG